MEIDRRHLLSAVGAAGMLAAASPLVGPARAASLPDRAGHRGSRALSVTPLALFAPSVFNDEGLFALGAASSGAAEVGEVLRIAQEVNARTGATADPTAADFDAYVDAFGAFADRLARLAERSAGAHPVTERDRLMRASMYAAQQLFFVLGTTDGSRELRLFRRAQSRWEKAVGLMDPAPEHTTVDSAFGPIPVHFFASPAGSSPRPTVIISEGSDGQNVETMQFGVTAALDRGYNVVLFEGPGQMTPLFVRRVPFTADWDRVVGPVLRWARARPDVGRVALIGISFAGMLCSRAAARLPGLDAVVLEPAAFDFTTMWTDQESMALVKQTHDAPKAEKEGARRGLNQGFLGAWPSLPREDQFTIYKRGSIFDRRVQREARAGLPVSDYYGLLERLLPFRFRVDFEAIRIPTMLTANEGDEFFDEQSAVAFGFLGSVPRSRKELVRFTAATGTSLHDQPVGPQPAQEVVFDWLDDQLR